MYIVVYQKLIKTQPVHFKGEKSRFGEVPPSWRIQDQLAIRINTRKHGTNRSTRPLNCCVFQTVVSWLPQFKVFNPPTVPECLSNYRLKFIGEGLNMRK